MNDKITLVLLDEPHEVPCEELEPERSRHTGQPIRRVRISFRVPPEDTTRIVEAFGKADDAADALVEPGGARWLVKSSSYSYSDGDRLHRHTAELLEVEEIRADRLNFLGLSLVPTHYKEEAEDEDGIFISARVDLDEHANEALEREIRAKRDDPYFEVSRVGVSEAQIRMRFGRCLWQKTPQGWAHLIRLVSEQGDTDARTRKRRLRFLEPEFGNVAIRALAAHEALDALLTELVEAGVLGESTADAIRARGNEAPNENARLLDETGDLDEYA